MDNTLPSITLTTWYKRLDHTNLVSLKTILCCLKIPFIDDSKDYICDSCNRAKATKVYNREPKKHVQQSYQFVHIDFVGLMSLISFSDEQYFFTFIDDCTKLMETYIANKKSDWLKCLKTYHSLCRTSSKEEHLIKRLKSDYGAKLQSYKANK